MDCTFANAFSGSVVAVRLYGSGYSAMFWARKILSTIQPLRNRERTRVIIADFSPDKDTPDDDICDSIKIDRAQYRTVAPWSHSSHVTDMTDFGGAS